MEKRKLKKIKNLRAGEGDAVIWLKCFALVTKIN